MSESDLKTEAQIDEFAGELFDEALDQEQGAARISASCWRCHRPR
jgi:hypothetical protein